MLLLIVLCGLLAVTGFVAGIWWRNYAKHRASALEYESHGRMPPPSTVCPQCRRRSYARRDVAEGYCEPCDLRYGQDQRAVA